MSPTSVVRKLCLANFVDIIHTSAYIILRILCMYLQLVKRMNTYLPSYLPTKTLLETGTKILTTSYQCAINGMHFVYKNIFEHNGKCHTISDHVRRICLESLEDNKLLVIASSENMINTQCTCTKYDYIICTLYDYTLFILYTSMRSTTLHCRKNGVRTPLRVAR